MSSNNRKEEIIMATLKLASENGIKAISMSMIANEVGIKKASLYNHFSSKEELFEEMYHFLRDKAKEAAQIKPIDYEVLFKNKTAFEIINSTVNNYLNLNKQANMRAFYKLIYSERCYNKFAAKILSEETDRMIYATKQLFYAMEAHHLLHFNNLEMSAISFALSIHGLMDYQEDSSFDDTDNSNKCKLLLNSFITWFCQENSVEE